MRLVVAFVAALVAAVPALATEAEPVVRDCGNRVFGDLGRGWRDRAVVAGRVAFVGVRAGYGPRRRAPAGLAWPTKVLVVVDPGVAATVTVTARSRAGAALAYHALHHHGAPVPLTEGVESVRFEACARANPGAAWNRGTQFAGYFLLAGPSCVAVEVEAHGRVLRRTLRFGLERCAG